MSRRAGRRKPWKEEHQTAVAIAVTVFLLFAAIYIIDAYAPVAPAGVTAKSSMQEKRR